MTEWRGKIAGKKWTCGERPVDGRVQSGEVRENDLKDPQGSVVERQMQMGNISKLIRRLIEVDIANLGREV